jgi:hypothetical protein
MPIALHLMTMNGAVSEFHLLKRLEADFTKDLMMVTVLSYSSEAAYLAGGTTVQSLPVRVPMSACASPVSDSMHEWLITDASSPFMGGRITPDQSDTLDAARARKVVELSQACAGAILAGFVSLALGAAYTYPAKANDQANLLGSVLRSTYPNIAADWSTPFWCADTDGAWEFRMHSAAQIQQVGEDAMLARLTCMGTNEQLAGQIAAAETIEDVAAIVWPA